MENNLGKNALKAQQRVHYLTGDQSQVFKLPKYTTQNKCGSICNDISIDCVGDSFVLDNVHNITITFKGKINHLLLLKSKNVNIILEQSCISGIDILYCSSCQIYTSKISFINLEFCDRISLIGSDDIDSMLCIRGCWDLKINGNNFTVSPFCEYILQNGRVGKYDDKFELGLVLTG